MNAPKSPQKKRGPKRKRQAVTPLAELVGHRLERLRGDQSLKDLAEELGTSYQALSLIETGQQDPNGEKANATFATLARHFQDDLGIKRLRKYVDLNPKARAVVSKLAQESGRSFNAQLYVIVIEFLIYQGLLASEDSAAA